MIDDKQLRLTVQHWAVDTMVNLDPVLGQAKIEAQLMWDIDAAMRHLRFTLKAPGLVLQQNKILAEYPISFWDYIKRAFRLRHRLMRVRLTEHLLFPRIQIPLPDSRVGIEVRVWPELEPPAQESFDE